MASISNIFIDQGADFTTTLTVNDSNGDALNLTNFTAAAMIRKTFLYVQIVFKFFFRKHANIVYNVRVLHGALYIFLCFFLNFPIFPI